MTLCLGRAGGAGGADAKTAVAFQMLEENSRDDVSLCPATSDRPRVVRVLS